MCGGHGQEGGDPQCDPGRNCLVVDPEGEPRDEDDHGGWHVDCQDEEGELPGEQVLVRSYKEAPGTWQR